MEASTSTVLMEETPDPEFAKDLPDPTYMLDHYKNALKRYVEYEGDSDEYDSAEEEAIIANLTSEEKAEYLEYREVYIKQLVHYGRNMPVDEEVRRHMFAWLPGCPENYVKVASEAVKKLRAEKEEVKQRRAEKRKLKLMKQQAPEDSDVIFIKFNPGTGPIIPTPYIKKEPVETTYEPVPANVAEPTEVEDNPIDKLVNIDSVNITEEDDEGDDTKLEKLCPRAADRDQVIKALKDLGAGAHQQALAYEKLVAAIPQLEDEELREVITCMPTPVSAHLSLQCKDYIEREEPLTVTHAIAIGSYYLEQHHASKDSQYSAPTKKAVAQRFGIEPRKFYELSQGIAYEGGSKVSPKKAEKSRKTLAK